MRRQQVLIGFLTLSVALLIHASADSQESRSRGSQNAPNILFILTDDQRWDTLGCYGNSDIKTPYLDKLAASGARLDAFYVAGPICCPSRASFLTGLYPHQTGIISNGGALSKEMLAVAGFLDEAGYSTGFIGKAHVGGEVQKWGFREFPIYLPGGESEQENPVLMVNGEKKTVKGNITEIFTDAALVFLDKHKSDRWFLWFATTAPHYPYYQDPRNPYKSIGAPPGWPKQQKFQSGTKWRDYYSTITMLDGQIGRILQKLNELGLDENTFVFFRKR